MKCCEARCKKSRGHDRCKRTCLDVSSEAMSAQVMLEPESLTFYECCETLDEIRSVLAEASDTAPEDPSEAEPEDEDPVAFRGWAYCVWAAPNARLPVVGVHSGSGRAWSYIATALGQRYAYSAGHRLRKAPSFVEAVVLYKREAERHAVPEEPAVFHH